MVKLKTLNDLIKKAQNEDELSFGGYTKDYLRDEAIEWIKSDKSNFYSKLGMEETKLWIKNFFNITDEDLK